MYVQPGQLFVLLFRIINLCNDTKNQTRKHVNQGNNLNYVSILSRSRTYVLAIQARSVTRGQPLQCAHTCVPRSHIFAVCVVTIKAIGTIYDL